MAYATKLQQDEKLDEAAAALTTYTTLKPKNEDALRQLAGIYLRRASDWQTIYTFQQQRTQAAAPSPTLSPKSGTPLSQAISSIPSPLAGAVASTTNAITSNAYQQFATALSQREGVWKKIAKLNPKDATTQLSLAQARPGRGRHEDGDRRVQGLLAPGAGRLGRPGGEEGAEAARGLPEGERELQREDYRQVDFPQP